MNPVLLCIFPLRCTIVMKEFKNFTLIKIMYYYEKILGLCPFLLNDTSALKFSYIGTTYNILLTGIYTYCFILIMKLRFELYLPRETTSTVAMDALGIAFQYGTIIASWLTLIFRKKSLKQIFVAFARSESLANQLNIRLFRYDSKKVRSFGIRLLLINLFYIAIFSIDYFTLTLYNKFQEQATAWGWFNLTKIVIYNVYFIYIQLTYVLQQNFKALNKVLSRSFSQRITRSFHDVPGALSILSKKLHTIGQFHDSLSDLLEYITNFFRLSVLFAITANFIHSFVDIYAIYLILAHGNLLEIDDFSSYTMNLSWLITKFLLLYFVCGVPDSTCAEVLYIVFNLISTNLNLF